MDRTRWRISLWPVLLFLMVLDVGAIIATVTTIWLPTFDPSTPYLSVHVGRTGTVTLQGYGPTGQVRWMQTGRLASALRALPIGWLVGTGVGLGLLTLAVSTARARRLPSSERPGRPRFTMSRGMVVIGAISVWLWLSRMEMFWIFCGSLVLLLALVAENRRNQLAREIKNEGASVTVWMRLAHAGYWVAVILALSWIALVLVLDYLEPAKF
jgi:hypothetical protein